MNKSTTTLLITIGTLFLLLIGIALLAIRPLWGRLGSLRAERTKTANELADLEKRVDTLSALAKKQDEVEELGRRAEMYLPTTVASAPYLMDLAAIGGLSGTNVPTVTFLEADTKKAAAAGLAEHPITLTVEGTFDQVKNFLGNLESNLRFTSLSSLTISTIKDKLALQLAGTIFSKPEVKSPKDTSLEITNKMEELLSGRRIFGASIQTGGPNRGDPFSGI